MKRIALLLAFAALVAVSLGAAQAASTSIVITVTSPPSTSVTCTPVTAFTTTAPAGATVCPIAVLPSGWTGSFTLSGADAAKFTISGTSLMVGSAALGAGTYNVTLTAAP